MMLQLTMHSGNILQGSKKLTVTVFEPITARGKKIYT